MKKYFFDSHGFMKPFVISSYENETKRDFEKRCWYAYLDMCGQYDGYNGSGNTVYMNDQERQIY